MTALSKILVVGATGSIGRHVVAGLQTRNVAVRAASHAISADSLPGGVEAVTADLTRPDTLEPALTGVDAVFLLWPFLSADGVGAVVDAIARHARRVVYVSSMNVRDDRTPAENGVWGLVEDAIRHTSLDWTFLRVSGLATNTLAWAPFVRAGQPVRVPYAQAARSLIHEQDVADVAVRILTEAGSSRATYVLTGPASVSQAEQVRILGTVTGQPSRFVEITPAEARAEMLTWAGPDFADSALAYWSSLVTTAEPVTRTVEEITGVPARTFERWARDHVDDFRPLSAAEVAERYVSCIRADRMDLALRLTSPDFVRVAPMEAGGDRRELRGLAEIMSNSARLNRDVQIHRVDVDGPFVHGDQFAVRFSFDQTHTPSGHRETSSKMCLYTVTSSAIAREEVFYLDPPLSTTP